MDEVCCLGVLMGGVDGAGLDTTLGGSLSSVMVVISS